MKLFSKILCKMGAHNWEWGPGACCADCGVEDALFGDNAICGRKAVNSLGDYKWFPENWHMPYEGYTWTDEYASSSAVNSAE